MTVESNIYDTLKGLVGNRVFPDVAPLSTVRPYITYSQIGGQAVSFMERGLPSKKHGRFQVNVWGDSRASVSAVILQVEAAMDAATVFQSEAVGAPSSDYDHDNLVFGSMQDFNIWSDR